MLFEQRGTVGSENTLENQNVLFIRSFTANSGALLMLIAPCGGGGWVVLAGTE